MKIGKIIMSVLLAGFLLVAAGAANAATRNIYIYGCSAQFFLWSSEAPIFLADATNGAGCNDVQYAFDTTGTTYFFATGSSCTNFDNDTINISVGYKTSNDAIWSVMGVADPENTSACPVDSSTGLYDQRKMATGFISGSCTSSPSGNCTNTPTCETITLGASDEKANWFTQVSHGKKYGPCDPVSGACSTSANTMVTRCFGNTTGYCLGTSTHNEPMPNDADLAWYNPIADPTAFYVNKAVTEQTCVGGTNAGDMCNPSDTPSDCPGGACGPATTITNISRMMAAQIFTGQVQNWQDFGLGFANLPVWACMRHTGAGTNITFDYAVLGQDHNWLPTGAAMSNTDSGLTGITAPQTWFYDTIATQLDCVNGIVDNPSAAAGFSAIGAIGYTDADRSTSLASQTAMVNYNGVQPSRRNIRNGLYDFWSKNYLYYNPTGLNCPPPTDPNLMGCSTGEGTNHQVFDKLVTYASNPQQITNLTTGKGNFWAALGPGSSSNVPGALVIPPGEMYYMKSVADVLPGPVNATNPVNP